MGNARSASYSYHRPLEQSEERHRSLPSPLQHYQYPRFPNRPESSYRHQPTYWQDGTSALNNNRASGSDGNAIFYSTSETAATCSEQLQEQQQQQRSRRRSDSIASETMEAALGVIASSNAEEPSPLPFVRHRNAPIRLPRININKESWPVHHQFVQPFGTYTLNKRGRHKSLSCSMMHGERPAIINHRSLHRDSSSPPPTSFSQQPSSGRIHVNIFNGDVGLKNESSTSVAATPPPSSSLSFCDDNGDDGSKDVSSSDHDGRLRGAVSCAALLLQSDSVESRADRSMATCRRQQYQHEQHQTLNIFDSNDRDLALCVNNNKQSGKKSSLAGSNNPFRRQFLSMRLYHYQSQESRARRPLLSARSSCTVRPSPSLSVPILTELDGGQFQNCKVKSYLEMARLKKLSVEQSLQSQIRHQHPVSSPASVVETFYAADLLQSSTTASTAAAADEPEAAHRIHQQLLDQPKPNQVHKSWTSISQESLGDGQEEEDEDGGYTTTLTVGDNGSLHSRFSDSSYLTLLTANTSLSSGYHGPASLGDTHPVSTSFSDDDIHRQQMMALHCDGTTSGLFYLDWLRQVTGSVPSYVELRHGRLHLKLIQGQWRLAAKLAHATRFFVTPFCFSFLFRLLRHPLRLADTTHFMTGM